MTAATSAEAPNASQRWRAVIAASIGNALEWFDFVVYGFLIATMAKLFFPTDNKTVSLLLALLTFGVPFIMRPLGAIILGSYADRQGRKAALTLTISLMMAGTAVIALAPTYASVGLLAPILVVAARMVQGFSAGGEFGSATAFLAEQNPQQRGFFASWQFASQGLTTILATGFGATLASTLTPEQIETWGWRLPFLFGLLIGPVAYYIRRHTDETIEFRSTSVSEAPLREALSDTKARLSISFGAVVLSTVAMYTVLYMPTYATRQLGLPASGSFIAGLLTGTIQLLLIPLVGALSDRLGRIPIAFAAAAAVLLSIYPMFAWLAASPDAADPADRPSHHGDFHCRLHGPASRPDVRVVPDPSADDRPVDQLFIRGCDIRRLRTVHQCVVDRADGQQRIAELLSDARGGDQPCGADHGAAARIQISDIVNDIPRRTGGPHQTKHLPKAQSSPSWFPLRDPMIVTTALS
jgi:MHS family proline/betaine transporter-like MFS transporter